MLTSRFAQRIALVVLPLTLAPPMATVGPYGVTLTELLVLGTGVLLLAVRASVAPFMWVFLFLYAAGWLGSLYNSFNWSIPIGPGNLTFLYTLGLALCGYCVGRYSDPDLREIVTSRLAAAIVISVALFAAAYPFLSTGTRALVMAPFINDLFASRLASVRFPGIGLNANVYSFIVLVFFTFSFDAFLTRRGGWVLPLSALIIIVAAAGRTASGMAIGFALVILGRRAVEWRSRYVIGVATSGPATVSAALGFHSRKRVIVVGGALVALTVAAVIYGAQVREVFALYQRFQDMFGGGEASGLATRTDVWMMGIARLQLAPILGIPRDPGRLDDANPLYFYTPHNEFIDVWNTFGVFALIAHVILLGRMIVVNVRRRAEMPWHLLYAGMIVQMMVDSVFAGPRTTAFFFVVIGLNVKYLEGRGVTAPPVAQQVPA